MIRGPGFIAVDGFTTLHDASLLAFGRRFMQESLHESEIHPDTWPPVIVHDPAQTEAMLAANPGNKYTYYELDNFTDL